MPTDPPPTPGPTPGPAPSPAPGSTPPPMNSFAEFWPFYLGEHLDPRNRWLHVCGTVGGLAVAAASVLSGWWWGLLLAPVLGYGAAWVGHFGIEKNRPASFANPLWSLRADFRLALFTLTGRLRAESERVGARCRF